MHLQHTNAEYVLWRERRREKITRYLEKKKHRRWDVLRYEVRKKIAKTRQRIKGRFVREDSTATANAQVNNSAKTVAYNSCCDKENVNANTPTDIK
jgi:hypothetical protein